MLAECQTWLAGAMCLAKLVASDCMPSQVIPPPPSHMLGSCAATLAHRWLPQDTCCSQGVPAIGSYTGLGRVGKFVAKRAALTSGIQAHSIKLGLFLALVSKCMCHTDSWLAR